jgi:hypothetical protein
MSMSAIKEVKIYIQSLPKGKPFTVRALQHLASPANARKILERLVQCKELARTARGIYVKPKKTRFGEVLPSSKEIAETAAKANGETIAIHGAEAARRLQLTTQMQMRPIFYTSGNTRKIKSGNLTITLQHKSPRKLSLPNNITGTVISALWYLGKEQVTQETIKIINEKLTPEEFSATLQQAQLMPAWMANQFYCYQQNKGLSNDTKLSPTLKH